MDNSDAGFLIQQHEVMKINCKQTVTLNSLIVSLCSRKA